MKSRRNTFVASDLKSVLKRFEVGDIVTSVITGSVDFIGTVVDVDEKVTKISVDWGDGSRVQHDPDEIQHLPRLLVEKMAARSQMASRRADLSREATEMRPFSGADVVASDVPYGDQFVGNPKTHGIDKPRGGGFSIMQNLQKDLAPEALEESEEGPKVAPQQAGMGEEEMDEAAAGQNAPGGDMNAPQTASVRTRRGRTMMAKKVEIPKEFMVQRKDIESMDVEISGNKINLTIDGKKFSYPNEWRKGWHNGVKRALNLPMGSIDKKFNAWAEKHFGAKKASEKKLVAKTTNLRTTVEDNHGNIFEAKLDDGGYCLSLDLTEKTGRTAGKWSWCVGTLLGLPGFYGSGNKSDEIALDAGQGWYVTGMKRLLKEVEKNIKMEPVLASDESLRSRRAMYWTDKDRVYRLTKNEQGGNAAVCPKCRAEMEKQPFTRSDKLFSCPGCGFKIPSSKVVTQKKVEVEVEPDGSIEVEIEPVMASRRGR